MNVKKILIAIIGLSCIASLAYSFAYRIEPVVDADAYDAIASNLAAGKGFREDAARPYAFDTAMLRAGPGYEFFLVGLYGVFGHHYEAVWIVQAILHALSAWILFCIARRIFAEHGERAGLIAAGIFGLHPDLIEISAMLMTETLYLFFVILAAYCIVRLYYEPERLPLALGAGAVTALAIFLRPPIALFVPIVLFMLYRARAYRSGLLYVLALGVALAPWVIRNYIVYQQFILTTLIGSYNLWIGNTLASDGGQIAGGFNPVTNYVEQFGIRGLPGAAQKAFFTIVFEQPLFFVKLCLLRLVRFFSLIRPMGFWFYQSGLWQALFVSASALWGGVLFITGYAGMAQVVKDRVPFARYLITLALTAPAALALTVVQSRYRFQIYPFLALFAGYFIIALKKKNPRARGIAAVTLGGLLVFSLADSWLYWPAVMSRLQNLF